MVAGGRRPTILDVARAAGVSVGSVSNVINGSRPVSEELQGQVLAAADALGFQINSIAQTLRRRSSKVIGLCTTYVTTVYLRQLADALDEIAARNGYDLVQVFTRQEPELELRKVRSLMGRQVDGLILLPSLEPRASLDAILAARTPIVVVDRLCEDERLNYVIVNNRAAMGEVVRSLVGYGHERLLFIAQNLGVITTRHRLEGLEEAAKATGGALRYEAIERGNDRRAFAERLSRILAHRNSPTAIVTGNSSVALWTIETLQKIGVRWPDDVALITFDDPEWACVLDPPLSTVKSPTGEIAEKVWSLLRAQLEGNPLKPQAIAVKSELRLRASSSAPARR